jgi:hypothetical protein
VNPRHQQFINEYIKLKCSNATEAYRRVYPKSSYEAARANAARLIAIDSIAEAIQQRVNEETMSADEVLVRIAEHGRGDIGEFINLSPEEIKQSGRSHLIKKFTRTITTSIKKDFESTTESFTVEMYDALAAKTLIGKYHKLWVDRTEVTGKDGKDLEQVIIYKIPDNGRD